MHLEPGEESRGAKIEKSYTTEIKKAVQLASWQSIWPNLEYESGKSFWIREPLVRRQGSQVSMRVPSEALGKKTAWG